MKDDDDDDVRSLPLKKKGRRLLLGEDLDRMVQEYMKKVREGGRVVSGKVVLAAAKGILLTCDQSKLVNYGGYVQPTMHWAYSLLKCMKFERRKVTTAKSKYSNADFTELKKEFLYNVLTTIEMEEIPPELVLNFDQTGIKIVPCNTWTMEKQGSRRVEVAGANDKRLITAIFCGSLVGDFLPVQVVYKGKTAHCHPHYCFPSDWDITHSHNHWSNERTMIRYIENIIIPYVQRFQKYFKDTTPALVIMDNFKGQVTDAVTSLLESNNIHVCLLPSNVTDRLQPMDLTVNKRAKAFLKGRFEEWYSQQLMKQLKGKDMESVELQPVSLDLQILKELIAKWMVEMANHFAQNPLIIVKGFINS